MKRLTSTIALVGIVSASLAGCSGTDTAGNSATAGGDKTLTVLSYNLADAAGAEVFADFFASCETATGYTFERLIVPQDQLITKATQLTASGDAPAMILSDNSTVATLADAGVLAPIDITSSGLKESDFVPGPYQSGIYNGEQYGLPLGNNGEVIVYDKGLLDKAGIAVPKTWAELTAAAKALTTGDQYGFAQTFAPGETMTWNWLTQLWSNGGSLEDLSGAPSVEAADFWTSFIRDGSAPQASLQWQATDIARQITDGKLAMGQVGSWTLASLLADAKTAGIEIGITEQVSPKGEGPLTPFGGEVMAAGAGATGDASKAVTTCITSFFTDAARLSTYDLKIGYLPSYIPAQAAVLKEAPYLEVLSQQLQNSRGRTTEVGAAYSKYTTAISTALQKIATGQATSQEAMDEAAASVK